MHYLFFLILLFSSCIKKESENIYDRLESEIQGRNLSTISEVIDDSLINVEKLILFVADGDCGSCVANGFKIFKDIKNNHKIPCIVISAGLNSGYIQMTYQYEDYIYQDFSDLIRKKLLFCYTPILFILDNQNEIKKVLVLSSTNLSAPKRKDFIKYLKKEKF
jgi:hypothetical protein